MLRRGRERFPGDFWVNFELANTCLAVTPLLPDEAVRYYLAALALRPDTPVVYCNLSAAYQDQGKALEAVAIKPLPW